MPRRADPASIVRAHQAGLWRYLRFLGCEANEADDLTQETMLAVLRDPFEDRGATSTAAYLRTVARNLFLKRVRSRGIDIVDPDVLDATWVRMCEADGGTDYLAALRECVDTLDGRARTAIRMRYENRSSRGAMARALELSADGVKSLLRRVRTALRECIERKIA